MMVGGALAVWDVVQQTVGALTVACSAADAVCHTIFFLLASDFTWLPVSLMVEVCCLRGEL